MSISQRTALESHACHVDEQNTSKVWIDDDGEDICKSEISMLDPHTPFTDGNTVHATCLSETKRTVDGIPKQHQFCVSNQEADDWRADPSIITSIYRARSSTLQTKRRLQVLDQFFTNAFASPTFESLRDLYDRITTLLPEIFFEDHFSLFFYDFVSYGTIPNTLDDVPHDWVPGWEDVEDEYDVEIKYPEWLWYLKRAKSLFQTLHKLPPDTLTSLVLHHYDHCVRKNKTSNIKHELEEPLEHVSSFMRYFLEQLEKNVDTFAYIERLLAWHRGGYYVDLSDGSFYVLEIPDETLALKYFAIILDWRSPTVDKKQRTLVDEDVVNIISFYGDRIINFLVERGVSFNSFDVLLGTVKHSKEKVFDLAWSARKDYLEPNQGKKLLFASIPTKNEYIFKKIWMDIHKNFDSTTINEIVNKCITYDNVFAFRIVSPPSVDSIDRETQMKFVERCIVTNRSGLLSEMLDRMQPLQDDEVLSMAQLTIQERTPYFSDDPLPIWRVLSEHASDAGKWKMFKSIELFRRTYVYSRETRDPWILNKKNFENVINAFLHF